MKISVVIPMYEFKGKGQEFLNTLLSSIKKQTYKDYEIIVADHSTSDVIQNECIKWKNINYFRNTRGIGNSSINMNEGIKRAKGDVIKIMHGDDFFCNDNAFELMIKKIKETNKKWGGFVFDHLYEKEPMERIIYPSLNDTFGCPSVLFFMNDKNTFFDENLIFANDSDIQNQLYIKHGEPIVIDEKCITIRMHENQLSNTLGEELLKKENEYVKNKYKNGVISMIDDELSIIANKYGTDKGTKKQKEDDGPRLYFTPIYNRFFEKIRYDSLNILEIGVANGTSLKMWEEFFPNSYIYGIDIVNSKQYDTIRTKTYIANQTNRNELNNVMNEIGKVDIIIDDGGHMMGQQQISFATLFKYVKPNGLYFIEDLHTSYWPYNNFSDLYGTKLDINDKRTNTTILMIEKYIKNHKIESEFMTLEEMEYLTNNIKKEYLFDINTTIYGPNKLAGFEKK